MTLGLHWVDHPTLRVITLCSPGNEREIFLFNLMRINKPAIALLLDGESTVTSR